MPAFEAIDSTGIVASNEVTAQIVGDSVRAQTPSLTTEQTPVIRDAIETGDALDRIKGGQSMAELYTRHLAKMNGTLCAMTRTIVAILETHQQADGSVRVPVGLRPYLGGLETLEPVR